MNTRNLLIASLVGGIASTLLSNVPILDLVNCLLCAGFWGGPLLAVWLCISGRPGQSRWARPSPSEPWGIWAGVFGFAVSLAGLAGVAALMKSHAPFLPPEAGVGTVPSGPASVLINLVGVGVNIVFGAIGGLLGGAIFKTKASEPTAAA